MIESQLQKPMFKDMDHRQKLELITRIEESFDVNRLQYRGIKVWPLLRSLIWTQIWETKIKYKAPGKVLGSDTDSILGREVRGWKDGLKWFLSRCRYDAHNGYRLAECEESGKPDCLFFTRAMYHSDFLQDGYADRHTDPILDELEKKYTCVKIETESDLSAKTQPRWRSTVFLKVPYQDLRVKHHLNRAYPSDLIDGFEELNHLLSQMEPLQPLDYNRCCGHLYRFSYYVTYFAKCLRKLKPRVVFSAGVNNPITMALIYACRQAGLPFVDIQHGHQGKYNVKYTRWTRMPEEGYELLPHYYWCWGETFQSNIKKWQPTELKTHTPLVGGYNWLGRWVNGDRPAIRSSDAAFLETLKNYSKVILVSLQPLETEMPEHLLAVMQSSPSDWYWLVRTHPLQRASVPRIQSMLDERSVSNFNVKQATYVPLAPLLQCVDIHASCWSSVCHEALVFGVPSIILHPNGVRLYEDYADKYTFQHAFDEESLRTALANAGKSESDLPESPFVKTGKEPLWEVMKEILS